MSWPSVIILVSAERRPLLEGQIRALSKVSDPVTGDGRLYWDGYSYSTTSQPRSWLATSVRSFNR